MAKPKPKSFYKVVPDSRAPNALKVLKFDSDLDLQSEYFMTYFEGRNGGYYDCSCPASKFDCRHKSILTAIQGAAPEDKHKFYCYDDNKFYTAEEM